ncbi:MAG TPA: DUF5668 domain-containing protein [Candidatus Limnocylindrales bacterium]
MRVNRGRLNWGVFLIVLGAMPLAYNQGVVSSSTLGEAWRLWPLVLVGLGLGLVLSRTPASFVGGLVVAICLGLVLGSLFAVGPRLGCGNGDTSSNSISRAGTFDGLASVELNLQCGATSVTTSPDASWHVTASSSTGSQAQVNSNPGWLSVGSDRSNWWADRSEDNWQVALPAQTPISLSASIDAGDAHFNLPGAKLTSATFSVNAGAAHIDLSGGSLQSLSVSTNAGSTSLTLDGQSDVRGSVSTNLGELKLCVPVGLGLQIRASDSLGGNNFGSAGLVHVGDVWQTPGYDSSTHKADLAASTSLGSLSINPAGGCK